MLLRRIRNLVLARVALVSPVLDVAVGREGAGDTGADRDGRPASGRRRIFGDPTSGFVDVGALPALDLASVAQAAGVVFARRDLHPTGSEERVVLAVHPAVDLAGGGAPDPSWRTMLPCIYFKVYMEIEMTSAKLFRNGQSQAVRLPKEFALPGKEVFVRHVGNAVLLVPKVDPWSVFEAALGQFTEDFLDERNQPGVEPREPI